MKLNKRLCDICRESFAPWHLKKIRDYNICPACLKLIIERKDEWLEAVDKYPSVSEAVDGDGECVPAVVSGTVESNLMGIVRSEGNIFFDDIRSASRVFSKGFIGVMVTRVSLYVGTFSYFDPQGNAHAFTTGVMAADLVTWVVFNILQLPFVATGFMIEFAIYGLMTAYLISGQKLIDVPDNSEQMCIAILVFLAVGFAKTGWWAAKLFLLDEPCENI
ncbi:MAG: hypothetical protein WC980_03740 [Candidatus Brocadiia bacterium]